MDEQRHNLECLENLKGFGTLTAQDLDFSWTEVFNELLPWNILVPKLSKTLFGHIRPLINLSFLYYLGR